MKKKLFCVVLVLCVVFSAVACAENTCDCNNGQSGTTSYSVGYNYTKRAEYGDFIVLLPSIFRDSGLKGLYYSEDCRIKIYNLDYDYDEISTQIGLETSDTNSVFEVMQSMLFDQGQEYDLISIKDCPALVRIYLDDGYLHKEAIHPEAEVYITNGKTTLNIEMSATETDVLTKYLDGILSHIIVNESEEE